MKFKLDENLPHGLKTKLCASGHDVMDVIEEGLGGAKDPKVLGAAAAEGRIHSITEARVAGILYAWLMQQPKPRGEVVCGEAGFLLRHDPDSITAGVDVALITAAQADSRSPDTSLVEGPAILIAEINSPYDTTEEIAERVEDYLDCGVKVVWVINPYSRAVHVHRPHEETLALDTRDTLDGDPDLPGFTCPVAALFR